MSHCKSCGQRMRGICKHCEPQEYIDMMGRVIEEVAYSFSQRPKREWVGLTDEEANELWESTDTQDDWELLKRVEAKLRSKNEWLA